MSRESRYEQTLGLQGEVRVRKSSFVNNQSVVDLGREGCASGINNYQWNSGARAMELWNLRGRYPSGGVTSTTRRAEGHNTHEEEEGGAKVQWTYLVNDL